MVNVLGISAYFHDSSAALVKDGVVVAAADEERFTRVKHDNAFPINAINYCLKEGGVTAEQIDYVAFYEKPFIKFERVLNQFLQSFPSGGYTFYKAMPPWLTQKLRIRQTLRKKLGFRGRTLFLEHHMAHAASSYLASPFDESAILTIDGVGEITTAACGYAKGNDITLTRRLEFPHSLGLLYSTITAYLGFKVNNDEYKVMGLAPYGKPTYYDKLRKTLAIGEDGSVHLDMRYFVYTKELSMAGKKLFEELGPPRKREEPVEQMHKDIAASVQKITEEVIIKMARSVYEETKSKNLCVAGGVALNSVANGKILRSTPFENIFIQPSAGDSGTSLGAALYAYNTILKNPRKYVQTHAYLGPGYSRDQIKKYLDENKIVYSEFRDERELLQKVSKLIWENNVIGWFQGRMEWGPRALGARSILSNPCNPEMKDILNLKVKHREAFRPFAPAVCVDDADEYFECDVPVQAPTDYMLMVYPIREEKRALLPAVTHVDGSGRLQTVRREQNPLYYDLIKEFGKLSGVPVLVNTSFNIRGEPIVCEPRHAYRCMMGTGIDFLVMDKFLIARSANPKDMWDSEKVAGD
ncbi:MAG: carbamoyltransferase [Candidatus Aenigmatarchaeota archaeon]|nr:MAG: carbamoyltransferase [Candidatus Aenigmarchaeota archaeon]